MGYPDGISQSPGDKSDNGNCNNRNNPEKSCQCSNDLDKPDEQTCEDKKKNSRQDIPSTPNDRACEEKCQIPQPDPPCSGNSMINVGTTNTVDIRFRKDSDGGIPELRTKADCVRIPLKSGGALDFTWYGESTMGNNFMYVSGTNWLPAGGGYFSFFPYLTITLGGSYSRLSRYGMMQYDIDIQKDTKTYFAPVNPASYVAWVDSNEFTEYDMDTHTYYVYGSEYHPTLRGCPIKRVDRFGNTIEYHYEDNPSGKALLRKITGDLAGITPYFEYDDEEYPAPIGKIYLYDETNPSASRTIYFEYDRTEESTFLKKIVYPNGCVRGYQFKEKEEHPTIEKEEDALGYTTYFNYKQDYYYKVLNQTIEPEERVIYYDYQDYLTILTPKGKPGIEYKYSLLMNEAHVPQLDSKKDSLGYTTYYEWTSSAESTPNPLSRIRKETAPNQKITYFQYNGQAVLRKKSEEERVMEYIYGHFANATLDSYESSLVAVWKMEDDTRTVYDAVGENNGRAGGFTSVVGKDGKAFEFNGIGGRIECGEDSTLEFTEFFSISAWVKPYRDEVSDTVFSRGEEGEGYILLGQKYDDSSWQFAIKDDEDSYTIYGGSVQTNQWQHLVAVKNGSSLKLYVNGSQVASGSSSITPLTGLVLIGEGMNYFEGIIDEVYVWNTNLSSDAVSALYNSGNGRFYQANLTVPIKKINPRGYTTYFEYDSGLNIIATVDPLGGRKENEYDSYGRKTSKKDERGNATYYLYNEETGNHEAIIDPLENITYFGYNTWGEMVHEVSPRWQESGNTADFTTYYQYDTLSRRTQTTDPLGNATYYFYTSRGDFLAEVNARGVETEYEYNGLRLKTKQQIKDSDETIVQSIEYGYDVYKNKIWEKNPLGQATYFEYDYNDRLVKTIDSLGYTTYYECDEVGNRTKTIDPRENVTYMAYDKLNQVTLTTDTLDNSTYYEYDVAGNRTVQVDALGHVSYFYYDALDRQKGSINALGNETYYEFDAAGNRITQVNISGYATYFYYDALNRQKGSINALGNETYFEFDAAGNQIKQVDALGNASYFYYDVLNRQKGSINALGNETYFEFDAAGNQVTQVDALSNASYFYYDTLNRQKGSINALGNETYFEYDANDNQIAQIDPLSNASYFYYDALNRVYCTADPIQALSYFDYDENGNRVLIQDAVGNSTYYVYDKLNRQQSMTNALGQSEYFTYDALSNLTSTKDPDGDTIYYAYDNLNRQSSIVYPDRFHYYEYDALSNLTKVYDERGWTYFTYDALSRKTKEEQPNGEALDFVYDKVGRRTYLNSSGGSVYYTYNAIGRMQKLETKGTSAGYGLQPFGSSPYGQGSSTIPSSTYYEYDPVNKLTKKTLGNGCYTYWAQSNNFGSDLDFFVFLSEGSSKIASFS